MKKDPESLIKKGVRSIAASFPVASSVAQWWSEMESDAQFEAIEDLQDKVQTLQNPILSSHPQAKEALAVIYKKIELTNEIDWEVDDELGKYVEVLGLWEKQNFMIAQHAIGNRWLSIRLLDPIFTLAVFGAANGDHVLLQLKQKVWQIAKSKGNGIHGDPISETLNIPLVYIDSLFQIFEAEGKGWKSNTLGECYFQPSPELC